MLTIGNYVKVKTLEEAYELNQARNSRIMGGMMWMRLGNARVKTIIDMSELGLNEIEETDHVFRIGAMCTLRQLEEHEGLRKFYGDGIAESLRHIVGVQFRNQATVGGSIYGRYGFSDVLTALLALDTFVELYNGGTVRLSEFVNRKADKDILVSVIVRKSKRKFRYESIRQTKTDFPVLTCSVVTGIYRGQESWFFSVGARPMKAALLEKQWEIPKDATDEQLTEYAKRVAAEFTYGSNMRGSAEYRQHLAEVLLRRVQNLVRLEARGPNAEGEGAVTIRDLIKSALRMRPDRIVVGEVRGEETVDMISSAMLNGHSGSMSTGHANNPTDMLHRLETMMLMGIDLPLQAIQRQVASALDIIIHLGRLRDKTRKVLQIVEVEGYEDGRIQTKVLYEFKEEGMKNGKIQGCLMKKNEITNKEKLLAAGYHTI